VKRTLAALGFLVSAVLAAPAQADPVDVLAWIDAPVDYSANYSFTEGDQTWNGTVVHAHNRERRDFATSLGAQALLMRRDTDQIAVLWPKRKFYLSTSLKALIHWGGANDLTMNRHHDGIDIINDEPCIRYTVTGAFNGRMWFTKDGILIRARGKLTTNGHERAVSTQLTHLKRGAVDADEFELPVGYHGIPVNPSMLGMQGAD
jgi:hypothetical protein